MYVLTLIKCIHDQVLAATKEKPLVLPTYAAYVHNHIKVRRRARSGLHFAQLQTLALHSSICHVLTQHGWLTVQRTPSVVRVSNLCLCQTFRCTRASACSPPQ